jgi:cytidylate kinase
VVAPLDERVHTVQERERLSEREARRRILEVESERRAYLLKHFHAEFADPTGFDVVVNTAALGVAGAVRSIAAALAGVPARPTAVRPELAAAH